MDSQPDTFYFYAGQHYRVGEVEIWKDGDYLYVQVDLDGSYQMTESHLNVLLTGYSGTPAFGLFPWTADHDPKVNTHMYKVAWNPQWSGQELNISLHGVVGPF